MERDPAKALKSYCGYSTVVSASAFQAGYGSSILPTRSGFTSFNIDKKAPPRDCNLSGALAFFANLVTL